MNPGVRPPTDGLGGKILVVATGPITEALRDLGYTVETRRVPWAFLRGADEVLAVKKSRFE